MLWKEFLIKALAVVACIWLESSDCGLAGLEILLIAANLLVAAVEYLSAGSADLLAVFSADNANLK